MHGHLHVAPYQCLYMFHRDEDTYMYVHVHVSYKCPHINALPCHLVLQYAYAAVDEFFLAH